MVGAEEKTPQMNWTWKQLHSALECIMRLLLSSGQLKLRVGLFLPYSMDSFFLQPGSNYKSIIFSFRMTEILNISDTRILFASSSSLKPYSKYLGDNFFPYYVIIKHIPQPAPSCAVPLIGWVTNLHSRRKCYVLPYTLPIAQKAHFRWGCTVTGNLLLLLLVIDHDLLAPCVTTHPDAYSCFVVREWPSVATAPHSIPLEFSSHQISIMSTPLQPPISSSIRFPSLSFELDQ